LEALEASEFRLVAEDGTVKAVLGIEEGRGVLKFIDGANETRLRVGEVEGGKFGLKGYREDGTQAIGLGVSSGDTAQAGFTMRHPNGEPAVGFFVDGGEVGVETHRPDGTIGVQLLQGEKGGHVLVAKPDGTPGAGLRCNDKGAVSVGVYQRDGSGDLQAAIRTNEAGATGLFVHSPDGECLVELGEGDKPGAYGMRVLKGESSGIQLGVTGDDYALLFAEQDQIMGGVSFNERNGVVFYSVDETGRVRARVPEQ
jgi:hypothetical protein